PGLDDDRSDHRPGHCFGGACRSLPDLARLPRATCRAVEDMKRRESGMGNRETEKLVPCFPPHSIFRSARIGETVKAAPKPVSNPFPIPYSRTQAMEIRPILSALMRS